ncbi:MAG: DUF2911 domain-containing protein [Acidobacteria bacterium]|nr:DUF2911 domain-containing protein [Acidobacteriota bacterium]
MIRLRHLYISAFALLFLALCAGQQASAQNPTLRFPRPSQKASVMQTIGVTDVTITYSRPGVKGRKIWGDAPATGGASGVATMDDSRSRAKDAVLVPYGHVWRTGANEATTFAVTDDVLINGQKLSAGTYSLHTIPGKDEWTFIFNSDAGQWGSFTYDEKKDTLRIKAKPQMVAENQEWMMFSVDPMTDHSAQVNLRWEKLSVPFTVEVRDVNAMTLEKARAAIAAAKPDDWRTPLQAANYAFQNADKADDAEAVRWLEQSIKIKETFQNMYSKARMLASQGKMQEAIAAGERALALGKEAKADTSDLEKRLAEWKGGKKM